MKRSLTWGGLAFLVFFLAYRPAAAADVLRLLGGTIADMVRGFGEWINTLVGG